MSLVEELPESANSEHTDLPGSLEDTSSLECTDDDSDMFKDSDCGEPLVSQHLVFDFTPTEEDTDYIQKKCCAFWEFINQHPELKIESMLDVPDLESTIESDDNDGVSAREETIPTSKLKSIEKTAVSMLELVEEKGLIDRAFESRLPTSHCSVGLLSYEDEQSNATKETPTLSNSVPQKTKSIIIKKHGSPTMTAASSAVRDKWDKEGIKEWDMKHPRSIEPPGPTPILENEVVDQPRRKQKPHIKECGCRNTVVCRTRTDTN